MRRFYRKILLNNKKFTLILKNTVFKFSFPALSNWAASVLVAPDVVDASLFWPNERTNDYFNSPPMCVSVCACVYACACVCACVVPNGIGVNSFFVNSLSMSKESWSGASNKITFLSRLIRSLISAINSSWIEWYFIAFSSKKILSHVVSRKLGLVC